MVHLEGKANITGYPQKQLHLVLKILRTQDIQTQVSQKMNRQERHVQNLH